MPFMQCIHLVGCRAALKAAIWVILASHGCVRLPHDFATRLWVLTKLGARVVIARPELRPEELADPHLFAHREISQAVPTASQPTPEQPIKTAQSLPADKTSDAPAASAMEPKEPPKEPVSTGDAGGSAPAPSPVAESSAASALRPSISDPATTPAAEPAPVNADTANAPQTEKPPAPVALPAIPVPPIKPTEIARNTPKTPISVFVSGKEKKIYVRQDFVPLFSAPVTIEHPDQRLGTHVFTALSFLDDHSHFRWNVISLPGEQVRAAPKTLGRGKHGDVLADAPPQTAKEALARIEIPQDIIDRISDLMVPGSSLVISDQGLGGETGEGTDFIVTMR